MTTTYYLNPYPRVVKSKISGSVATCNVSFSYMCVLSKMHAVCTTRHDIVSNELIFMSRNEFRERTASKRLTPHYSRWSWHFIGLHPWSFNPMGTYIMRWYNCKWWLKAATTANAITTAYTYLTTAHNCNCIHIEQLAPALAGTHPNTVMDSASQAMQHPAEEWTLGRSIIGPMC